MTIDRLRGLDTALLDTEGWRSYGNAGRNQSPNRTLAEVLVPHYEPRFLFDGADDSGYEDLQECISRYECAQAYAVGRWLYSHLRPASVIDIGCGSGVYLKPYAEEGCEVLGIDSCQAAGQDLPHGLFERVDLRFPYCPDHRYDLAIFLEVGEHLEPHWAPRLIDTVYACSDTVLVSWAAPRQGGHRHQNCRSQEWVLDLFRRRYGYELHPSQPAYKRFVQAMPDIAESADASEGATFWLKSNSFLIHRPEHVRKAAPWTCPAWIDEPQSWLDGQSWSTRRRIRGQHPDSPREPFLGK